MATAASTSMSAAAVFLPRRLPTYAVTPRCSALPCLPPPRFSYTQALLTSLKQMSCQNHGGFLYFKSKLLPLKSCPLLLMPEIFSDLKEKWDALENKSTVILYGGGAIVAVWLYLQLLLEPSTQSLCFQRSWSW